MHLSFGHCIDFAVLLRLREQCWQLVLTLRSFVLARTHAATGHEPQLIPYHFSPELPWHEQQRDKWTSR